MFSIHTQLVLTSDSYNNFCLSLFISVLVSHFTKGSTNTFQKIKQMHLVVILLYFS